MGTRIPHFIVVHDLLAIEIKTLFQLILYECVLSVKA